MNRILVATDGSGYAAEAAEFGVELAAEHEAELIFVHIIQELDLIPATVFAIGGASLTSPRSKIGRCWRTRLQSRRRTASSPRRRY